MSVNPNADWIAKQKRFMELYEPLNDRLARFVYSMVWDREEARDVISDTVLAAYESFEKVRNHQAFLSYLFTIASRTWMKRVKKTQMVTALSEYHTNNIADEASNIESRAELNEFYAALGTLPEKQREAVSLFEISGLSLNEILEIQGGSLSGVKSRVTRGREELARILERK
jgi:RNA polymerase sigma-70 factor (ECF subfamily)